jgi:hypothetical protein
MRILPVCGALFVLATGCSAPEPGRGDGVVLLADLRRGLAPSSDLYAPPDFVLYADGTAVVEEVRGSEVPRLVEYHLTPRRVRALFAEADDAGLFDDEDYALDAQVMDAGSLVLALRTTEREHVVEVVLPNPGDGGARGDVAAFAESLQPSRWAESDFTRLPAPYRPGRVAVTYEVVPADGEESRVWPLPEREAVEPRCAVLTGTTATRAQELSEREPSTVLWRSGDVTFRAWVRPLLPDEADCEDTELRHRE